VKKGIADAATGGLNSTETVDHSSQLLDDIETEAVSLVSGLRANSSIPYSVVPNTVDCFNNMASSLTSFVQREVVNSLLNFDVR